MNIPRALRTEIKQYLVRIGEIRNYLSRRPGDWQLFQSEFDQTVAAVSEDVLRFERENIQDEKRVYRFKQFFDKKLRSHFLHGQYVTWSFRKPYGYAGDFKIIDDIYLNQAEGDGYARLFDEHFLKMPAAVATRNRKEDFKNIIVGFLRQSQGNVRIMDLASGPCRDLKELYENYENVMRYVTVDCCDFDINAIEYGKNLLGNSTKVNFFKKNALRLALKKDVKQEIPYRYDLIYSTGLIDYLDERIATKLITNLRLLLKENGILTIANYRDRYSNPSVYLMEWVADWNLIYRTENEFKRLFQDAGFAAHNFSLEFEEQKIMQYAVLKNS